MRPHRPPGSPWVESNLYRLRPAPAKCLDLACGRGRHSLLLLDLGYEVTALDSDAGALAVLEERAADAIAAGRLRILKHDLEEPVSSGFPKGAAGPWPASIAGQRFAAVLMVNYLHRPLLPHMLELLEPGGLLICETWAKGNEAFAAPKDSRALTERSLWPNELLELVLPRCEVLGFAHGTLESYEGRDCAKQMICARLLPSADTSSVVKENATEQKLALRELLTAGSASAMGASLNLFGWEHFGKRWLRCEGAVASLDLDFGTQQVLSMLRCYEPGPARQAYMARMRQLAAGEACEVADEACSLRLWGATLVRRLPCEGSGELRTETLASDAEVKAFFDKADLSSAEDFQHRGQGWTVVVNQLHGASTKLRDLQHGLFCRTGLSGGLNAYLTPSGAIGKPPHIDDHDVVVLQLEGRKVWSLLAADTKETIEEVDLRRGDVLYLPQGVPHHARAHPDSGSPSLHLAVGLHRSPMSVSSLLGALMTLHTLGIPEPGPALPTAFVEEMDSRSAAFAAHGGPEHWLNQLLPAKLHVPLVWALDLDDLLDPDGKALLPLLAEELARNLLRLAALIRQGPAAIRGDSPGAARQRALQQASVLGCERDLEAAAAMSQAQLEDLALQAAWACREHVHDRHFAYFGPRGSLQTTAAALGSVYWQRPAGKVAALQRPQGVLRVNGHRLSELSSKEENAAACFCLGVRHGAAGRPFALSEVQAFALCSEAAAERALRSLLRVGALEPRGRLDVCRSLESSSGIPLVISAPQALQLQACSSAHSIVVSSQALPAVGPFTQVSFDGSLYFIAPFQDVDVDDM
ncbi:unnamed protein product [Polarella glacialis]|uniref:Bifunctional lysine-specific demethylase and histidyl-hydroxylase n=1 Tax=Polarella glacialis TaxID=89957 RepID=A0A813D489_POLGL|nr:unnamed protein product [Polarella glacialis]